MEEVPKLQCGPESPEELVTDVNPCCSPPPGFGFCWFSLIGTFFKAPLAALPSSVDRVELPPCAPPICDGEHRVSQRYIKRSSRFVRPDGHPSPSPPGRGGTTKGSQGSRRPPSAAPEAGRSHRRLGLPASLALRETSPAPALALPQPGLGKSAITVSLNGCSGHAPTCGQASMMTDRCRNQLRSGASLFPPRPSPEARLP